MTPKVLYTNTVSLLVIDLGLMYSEKGKKKKSHLIYALCDPRV